MKTAWILRTAAALMLGALLIVQPASAAVSISVRIGPPLLPVYEQPVVPGDGYVWTPGYWAWSDDLQDYYWVPGTWVVAPRPGLLWTPAYWAWDDGVYVFHEGYWGPRVGFYGGINYGFGYPGVGFRGGYWRGTRFYYNESVTHVDKTVVRNVYNETVINNNVTINRVSFNGGAGGVQAQPTAEERMAEKDAHLPPVAEQEKHVRAAQSDPQLRASANKGRPAIAATQRPAEMTGAHVKAATNAAESGEQAQARASGSAQRSTRPNEARDRAREEQAMHDRQDRERQELQARQEDERKSLEQAPADEHARQRVEDEHARQTQEMKERHEKENADFAQRYAGRKRNGEDKGNRQENEGAGAA